MNHKPLNLLIFITDRCLQQLHEARVEWPTFGQMHILASSIENRNPLLKSTFAFMDGTSCPLAVEEEQCIQNAYWCGWKHQALINNVFVESPSGLIIWCAVNYPGFWHDSAVARPFLDALVDDVLKCPVPFNILGDSAFVRTGPLASKAHH